MHMKWRDIIRELTKEELNTVQGGIIITTTVVACIGLATAGLYLLNTLATMFFYSRSGNMPAQPSSQDLSQVANSVNTIANAMNGLPSQVGSLFALFGS